MKKFAVMGSPIQHSLSPAIHKLFAQQFNIDLEYTKLATTKDNLHKQLTKFKTSGGTGINLTSPLKEISVQYVDDLSIRAKKVQSVNTLHIKEGKIIGDNTDGVGFIRAVEDIICLRNKHILILGAGGALKGILPDIIASGTSKIHIANRTLANAKLLAAQYDNINISSYEKIPKHNFDVIINATSILKNDKGIFKSLDISADFFLDLQYNKNSAFFDWCMQKKVKNYISGLAMLVEQAAEGFYLWHGVMPDTKNILNELK